MKMKMQETTSVGTAIALSISDPGNQDAVFVPFSRPNEKKKKPIGRNYNMKSLLESLQLGGMDSVVDALRSSLNESEKSPEKSAEKIKKLLECKKNKEEFKKLMAEKKAKKDGNGSKPVEEKPAETPKKMSLKDKIAQKRAARQQKVDEDVEANKCPECGNEECICESKTTCEYCGKENCICEDINNKKCCAECADGLKKKQERINEGVKRLAIRLKLDEAKKRHEESKKKLDESAPDFSKEMKLMQAARAHKLNEDFTNEKGNCDDVMIGIVIGYWDVDPEGAEKIHNYAQEVGMEFKDDQMDKFVFGLSLSNNKDKSVEEITAEVDKVSAGLFEVLKELGIAENISTHTSFVVITD